MTDYYSVLGVTKNASAADIKKAFHKLAKQYHPDATGGDAASKEKFVKISEAYETLSDAEKRKAYDEEQANPFMGRQRPTGGTRYEYASADNMHFDDLLRDLFGGATAQATRQRKPTDVAAKCEITPWLAALGGRIDVRVSDKTLSVKIPPGSKSGQKLRLRGQGLPNGQGQTGDLLIELTIQNPRIITPEMKQLFERMSTLAN